MNKYIVIQGIKGGVGCTTVTTNLAVALQKVGANCIVVDLSEQDDLKYHFGGRFDDPTGLFTSLEENKPWFKTCYQDLSGVKFFPYGSLNPDRYNDDNSHQNKLQETQSGYITQLMETIEGKKENTIILFDAPHYNDKFTKLLSHVDKHLIVANCDPSSYVQLMSRKRTDHQNSVNVILNRCNPNNELAAEMHTLMQSQLPSLLGNIMGTISQNEMVPEALAQGSNLMNTEPLSITAKEFHFLAIQVFRDVFSPINKTKKVKSSPEIRKKTAIV